MRHACAASTTRLHLISQRFCRLPGGHACQPEATVMLHVRTCQPRTASRCDLLLGRMRRHRGRWLREGQQWLRTWA